MEQKKGNGKGQQILKLNEELEMFLYNITVSMINGNVVLSFCWQYICTYTRVYVLGRVVHSGRGWFYQLKQAEKRKYIFSYVSEFSRIFLYFSLNNI